MSAADVGDVAEQIQIFVNGLALKKRAEVLLVAGCLIGAGTELFLRNGGSVEHALQAVSYTAAQLGSRSDAPS